MNFTIFFKNGLKKVITGDSISEALSSSGFSAADAMKIDFYMTGIDQEYGWNAKTEKWEKSEAT